jgi:hypothetical protein
LHEQILSTPQNVYVNVTSWHYQVLEMFMWMLHDGIINSSIRFCECNIYMNRHYQLLKMFMWMLHSDIINFSGCLGECYILILSSSRNVYVNITQWQYQILNYVNVTSWHYQVLEMFMWMLHDGLLNSSKCLCECYILMLSTSQNV